MKKPYPLIFLSVIVALSSLMYCTRQATTPASEVSGRVVYSITAQSQGYIYSVMPNGENVRQIAYLQSRPLDMSWSADGSWLVFTNYIFDNQLNLSEIYRVDADGGNIEMLTDLQRYVRNPSISSDGKYIAFEIRADHDSLFDSIYVMHADGSNVRGIAAGSSPVWQPGSGLIAYTRQDLGDNDIWLMDTDGTNVRQVTSLKYEEYPCDWSSDGSRLLFRSYLSGHSEICIVDADGRNLRQLTHFLTFTSDASYSPDGQRIIFFGEGEKIYMMRPDGTDIKLINIHGLYPDWGPDFGS